MVSPTKLPRLRGSSFFDIDYLKQIRYLNKTPHRLEKNMKYLFFAFAALAFALSTSPVLAQKGKVHKAAPPHVAQTHIHPHYGQPHYVQPHYAQKNIQVNHYQTNVVVRPVNNYYVGGTHYRGRNYNGWTSSCYFPAYRCYGFYCAVDLTWYYWYAPQNCFLPVYYMQTMPPVAPVVVDSLPIGAVPIQPQADMVETEIIVTVQDRIRDTGDLNKVLLNKTHQFKMVSITKLASNTYRVVLNSRLPERELCGEISRLPGVVYAER
jgi:hypothetical protein